MHAPEVCIVSNAFSRYLCLACVLSITWGNDVGDAVRMHCTARSCQGLSAARPPWRMGAALPRRSRSTSWAPAIRGKEKMAGHTVYLLSLCFLPRIFNTVQPLDVKAGPLAAVSRRCLKPSTPCRLCFKPLEQSTPCGLLLGVCCVTPHSVSLSCRAAIFAWCC
jgi:hypothetical protein